MILYFEINFDDANSYWVDNIKPIDKSLENGLKLKVDDLDGGVSNSYRVMMDLDATNYRVHDEMAPILKEVKFNFLRREKIKKILIR